MRLPPSPTACSDATVAMSPGKRKAPSSPGSRPPTLAAPGSPRFLPCPICGKSFVARIVQEHAWSCTGAPPNKKDTGGDGKSDDGKFVHCPVCSRYFPQHAIESHAWGCVPSTRQVRLTDDLEGAAADQRTPAGAGKGVTPAGKDQPQGLMTDKRTASPSRLSRGSKVNLLSRGTSGRSAQEMTVPRGSSQQGDAVQASASRVCHQGVAVGRPPATGCAVCIHDRKYIVS